MAKKKVSKTSTKKDESYRAELWGVFFILIGVLGFGSFGVVGRFVKGFAVFLFGAWYIIFYVLCICIGLYMLIKRKRPNYFTTRMIGLYLVILSILVYSHLEYAIAEKLSGKAIIEATISNFMNTSSATASSGGGIIGGLFTILFTSLFDYTGTKIVLAVILLLGILLLFNLDFDKIGDWFKNLFDKVKIEDNGEDEEGDEDDEKPKNKLEAKKNKDKNANDEKDNKSLDDTVCTESLENVKVYSNMGDLLGQGNQPPKHEEQLEMSFNQNNNSSSEDGEDNADYKLPTLDILDKPKPRAKVNTTEFLQTNKAALERVLNDFQISGRVVEIHEGPAVTQFEVEIKNGTRVSRITSINKEIALALAAKDVRIEAPIPGKSTVGIEIPNQSVVSVPIREVLSRPTKEAVKAKIPVALGKDLMGQIKWADISKMPHLLVAGSTGSGKSVCINSFIASILMTKKPNEVKLVLVDPKKVELSNYNGVPHLLWPVVTDPHKASAALQKVVIKMEKRYEMFADANVKNIAGYNELAEKKNKEAGHEVMKPMYYLVVIIDELADLMVVAAKEVEDSIMRITQMARAAGIHLIVATQRPSTDVITGVVKANIPSRIAFAVASYVDSRTILDMSGAEKLLGKGDMLYLPMGENTPVRVQGNFISDGEIDRLIQYVSKQQTVSYDHSLDEEADNHMAGTPGATSNGDDDVLYNDIVEFAVKNGKISTSLIQRRFKIGYNRASRLVDLLEERGIVGPQNGSKPREVLVKVENNEGTDN